MTLFLKVAAYKTQSMLSTCSSRERPAKPYLLVCQPLWLVGLLLCHASEETQVAFLSRGFLTNATMIRSDEYSGNENFSFAD